MTYRPKPPDEIRRNMSAIRSRDNQTELALRRRLHAHGLRFRLQAKGIEGNPDIVFPRERVAIFVDGDFWHARMLREEGLEALQQRIKAPGQAYWLAKFARRIARDDEVNAALRSAGWVVLRFWETELKADTEPAVRRVLRVMRERRRMLAASRGSRTKR